MVTIELVSWKPRRSHAKNRNQTLVVIGVTNYDGEWYRAMFEVDRKDLYDEIMKLDPLMVVETMKGYHCYLPYKAPSPVKAINYVAKIKIADRGHIRLAKTRLSDEIMSGKLILRVSPKYLIDGNLKKDLKILHLNGDDKWITRVASLIRALNS